jgi:hypothetical protein
MLESSLWNPPEIEAEINDPFLVIQIFILRKRVSDRVLDPYLLFL